MHGPGRGPLPTFLSREQLAGSLWLPYLRAVYGHDDEFTFPIALSTFTLFYTDALPRGLSSAPPRSWRNAWQHLNRGDLLESIDDWFAPPRDTNGTPTIRLLWVYMYQHAGCSRGSWPHTSLWDSNHSRVLPDPPFAYSRGFANGSLIEVWHATPPSEIIRPHAQTGGVWLYLAIGSGIFHNLGHTAVFSDHQQAAFSFGLPIKDAHNFRKLSRAARAAGLDTLQFTHRCETIYKFEVVDVRGLSNSSDSPCPDYAGASAVYRSGWRGARRCRCRGMRNRTRCLNCRSQPSSLLRQGRPLLPFCSPHL